MIYRFTCKAAGDVIVPGSFAHQILRIIGKEPSATGILSVAALPAALLALSQAVARDSRHSLHMAARDAGRRTAFQDEDEEVSLRQRVWPIQEMLQRAIDEEEPVVWTA